QLSSKVLAPGGNTPRIMETTGQVSHTGTSDYPHYQGHSQGNGLGMAKARVEPRTMKLLIFAFGTLALAEILAHGPFEKRQPTI
ncbi:hypothetical protein ACUY2T_10180, partial [Corynebacterium sp. 22_2729]